MGNTTCCCCCWLLLSFCFLRVLCSESQKKKLFLQLTFYQRKLCLNERAQCKKCLKCFLLFRNSAKRILSGQLRCWLLNFFKMQFLNILYVEVNDDGGGNISCRKFNFQQENTLKRQTKLKTLFLVMQLKVQVFQYFFFWSKQNKNCVLAFCWKQFCFWLRKIFHLSYSLAQASANRKKRFYHTNLEAELLLCCVMLLLLLVLHS